MLRAITRIVTPPLQSTEKSAATCSSPSSRWSYTRRASTCGERSPRERGVVEGFHIFFGHAVRPGDFVEVHVVALDRVDVDGAFPVARLRAGGRKDELAVIGVTDRLLKADEEGVRAAVGLTHGKPLDKLPRDAPPKSGSASASA